MTNPKISYIAAVYNKADVLKETLAFLRNQEGIAPDEAEFIFADDCSSDGSLDLLKSEADKDPRIRVIANAQNTGPAIRFNQAASHARGDYILALDADDMVPRNASRFLLSCAATHNVPLVFGKSRRSETCPDIGEGAEISIAEDPLAFCAKKKIVRMGFLAKRDLWAQAGGADERLFIQDQSLPLRLSHHAPKLAYVHDYIYHLRPADDSNLSANVMQQHHDRFFALLAFLEEGGISKAARKAIIQQLVSTLWKAERDSGRPLAFLSSANLTYLANKLTGHEPSLDYFLKRQEKFLSLEGIRRV